MLVALGVLLQPVHAGSAEVEVEVEVEPGITPDSPLYFLDRLFEAIAVSLTFDPAKKAELRLRYAEERLAELEVMKEKNKTEVIKELSIEYAEELEEAEKELEKAEKEGKNVTEIEVKLRNTTARHIEVLTRVYQEVPEEARPAILQAINMTAMGADFEIEMRGDGWEIEIEREGGELEIEYENESDGRARAGRIEDGELEKEIEVEHGERERRIEVEIRNTSAVVEVELNGVERTFVLNTTDRDEILREIAERTNLSLAEIENIVEVEVEVEHDEDRVSADANNSSGRGSSLLDEEHEEEQDDTDSAEGETPEEAAPEAGELRP